MVSKRLCFGSKHPCLVAQKLLKKQEQVGENTHNHWLNLCWEFEINYRECVFSEEQDLTAMAVCFLDIELAKKWPLGPMGNASI